MAMDAEKEKRKNKPPRWYWTKRIFGIGFVGFVVVFVGGFLSPVYPYDYKAASLPAELVPIAQNLIAHPKTPDIMYHSDIEFVDYAVMPGSNRLYSVPCITLGRDIDRLSEFYLNGQPAPFNGFVGLAIGYPWSVTRCQMSLLDSGLYLVELRLKQGLFAEPYYSYQWGFEIK